MVWSHFMNGVVCDELSKCAHSDIMKIFLPAKILKEIDLTSGGMNLQEIEIL